jgi:hypothetical protein
MKLTTGTIVAGATIENAREFTVRTQPNAEVKLGDFVACMSDCRIEEGSLRDLVRYLEERPELVSDKAVRAGVNAIRTFLEH